MAGESDPTHIGREELKNSIPQIRTSGGGPRGRGSGYTAISSYNNIREKSEPTSSTSSSASNGSSTRSHARRTNNTPLADNNNYNTTSLEWVNSTIQSLAAGKNAADRKRVRSHVMAQRNRKKRQEEVERYQKLKTKSTVMLRPAPVPEDSSGSSSASTAATTSTAAQQNQANAGNLPSTLPDEAVSSSSRPETPIKSGTPVSLVSRKRVSQARKRSSEASGITKSGSTPRPTPRKDLGIPTIKREDGGYVYEFNNSNVATTTTTTTESANEDVEDFRVVKKEESLTPSPLTQVPLWSYVGQGSGDPFAAMAMKVSGRIQEYIHYYVNIIVPRAYPLCRSSRFRDRYNWGGFAQESPGLLHGLISGAATHHAMARGIPPTYGVEHLSIESLHPTTVDSLYHKGEAIRLVNKQLSNPADATTDPTVIAITVLLIGEIFKGHYDQIQMHLEGLRRVVTLRGSLGDFPWPVICQIKIADIKIATIQLTKPIFPFPRRFYSSPTSTTIDPGPNLSKQGSRLFSPENSQLFHEEILSTFDDLTKMVWYAEFIRNCHPSSSTSLEDIEEDYFVHQIIYIEHRLLCFPFEQEAEGERRGGRPENKVQFACRFICLLFTLNVLWGHYSPMSPVTRKPLMALRHSIGEPPLDLNNISSPWASCPDIFVWVMFIGAHSSLDHPERPFFVTEFMKGLRVLGLETCEEARELLLGFFYTDYAFWESLTQVWKEGVGGF